MTGGNYSRCDWYSATVDAPTDALISSFLTHFDATSRELPVAHNGFERAAEIVHGDARVAVVSWGGVNVRPSVVASGAPSQGVMEYLRSILAHTLFLVWTRLLTVFPHQPFRTSPRWC